MKLNVKLPNVDKRCQRELKYLLFAHIFGDISMKGLCHSAGIQPRQLYRAWNGECSYRSQQSVALTLIANLPYEVSDELISKANDLLDGIADSLLEIFKEDTENYKEDGEIYE